MEAHVRQVHVLAHVNGDGGVMLLRMFGSCLAHVNGDGGVMFWRCLFKWLDNPMPMSDFG